ncbi:hypothetical protein QSU92_01765 [Microbacterium sp. ET2]|nr:hypothetical protein [Microbacterium sp. ET2 (Ac-2212)]WJL95967.1 hypothetical protein QSU92_01765 [Microbacterium sp. ET2 (Ac-2212)]
MTAHTSATEIPTAQSVEDAKPLVPGENLLGEPSLAGSCCGGGACGV